MRDFAGGEMDQAMAQGAADRIRQFADGIKGYLPAVVKLQVENDVEHIEETNGILEDVFNVTGGAEIQGQASSFETFSGVSGAVVTWRTPGVRNGRRVRGRTFLVPLSGSAYDSTGTLSTPCLTAFNAAASALVSPFGAGAPDLGVYARPTTKGATDGIWYAAGSHSINDRVAMLTSRRD
jgi:hypothetical protein